MKTKTRLLVLLALLFPACEVASWNPPEAVFGVQLISEERINPKATIIQKVSVKLIYGNESGEPITPYTANGTFKDIEDIIDQVDLANELLEKNGSELGIDLVEIVDLTEEYYPGVSQFYDVDWRCSSQTENCKTKLLIDNGTDQNWDYFISLAKTGRFGWRDDMVNVYINGYYSSGGCDDIHQIQLGGGASKETLLHELGHGLNLQHTHDSDYCFDTLIDKPEWEAKDIAQNNPGATDKQIRETYQNIMSYHNQSGNRKYFTECQLGRISNTLQKPEYSNLFYGVGTNP